MPAGRRLKDALDYSALSAVQGPSIILQTRNRPKDDGALSESRCSGRALEDPRTAFSSASPAASPRLRPSGQSGTSPGSMERTTATPEAIRRGGRHEDRFIVIAMALSALLHGGLVLMAPAFDPAVELDLSGGAPLVLEIQLQHAPAVAGDGGAGSVPSPGAGTAVPTPPPAEAASETEARPKGDPEERAEAAAEPSAAPLPTKHIAEAEDVRPTESVPSASEQPFKGNPEGGSVEAAVEEAAAAPTAPPIAETAGVPPIESVSPAELSSENRREASKAPPPPKPKSAKVATQANKSARRPPAPAADTSRSRGTGEIAESSPEASGSVQSTPTVGASTGRATGKGTRSSQAAAGPGHSDGAAAALLPAPTPRYSPIPEYPEQARWEERTGAATVSFRIRPNGSVYDVGLISSSAHRDLDQAAMRAIARWLFKADPSASSKSRYRYRFRFQLE